MERQQGVPHISRFLRDVGADLDLAVAIQVQTCIVRTLVAFRRGTKLEVLK
jgi:hypothetical protein